MSTTNKRIRSLEKTCDEETDVDVFEDATHRMKVRTHSVLPTDTSYAGRILGVPQILTAEPYIAIFAYKSKEPTVFVDGRYNLMALKRMIESILADDSYKED
jgi:hypothetical protein